MSMLCVPITCTRANGRLQRGRAQHACHDAGASAESAALLRCGRRLSVLAAR